MSEQTFRTFEICLCRATKSGGRGDSDDIELLVAVERTDDEELDERNASDVAEMGFRVLMNLAPSIPVAQRSLLSIKVPDLSAEPQFQHTLGRAWLISATRVILG